MTNNNIQQIITNNNIQNYDLNNDKYYNNHQLKAYNY